MPDTLSPTQRARCMSHNRSTDTSPELKLRRQLWRRGYRYRVHARIRGRPDLVFKRKKVAVFVDGCFWHGCQQHKNPPRTNAAFWKTKIQGNVQRDHKITKELTDAGWVVLRFWEHEVKRDAKSAAARVISILDGGRT